MTNTISIVADACSSVAKYQPTDRDVRRHMHLVYRVVGRLQRKLPRSVQRDDLVSAGSVGLLAALARSGGDVEAPSFECYACIRIRGAILDELRRLDWSPRRRKASTVGSSTVLPAAEPVGPPAVTVIRFDDLPPMQEPQAPTGCPEKLREASDVRRAINAAMDTLPERERTILELRYFEDVPAKEIAAKLNVSEARISQLHARAASALRRVLVEHDLSACAATSRPPPSTFPPPPACARRRKNAEASRVGALPAVVMSTDYPEAA